VIRNIEVLGQAVKGISDDTRALELEVPWRKIAGVRLCLSLSIDLELDLVGLKQDLEDLLGADVRLLSDDGEVAHMHDASLLRLTL
jgi:uncharacterized protein with HEPN domain